MLQHIMLYRLKENEIDKRALIIATLISLGISIYASYDAYKTTKKMSRTVGAFLFPLIWLTLFKEW